MSATLPRAAHNRTRAPRWERRKESRPAELIAAALELFVEHGFAATRLDEIAARAGVSKGTLYLYFESKEDLFKAVIRENLVPLLADFQHSLEAIDEPATDSLARFLRTWWDCFGATRLAGIAKLILSEAAHFPDLARFFHDEVIARNDALLASIVQRGVARGELRPIDPRAACQFWLAPLVLKAIWSNSFDVLYPPQTRLSPAQFLDAHIEFVLASARTAP